MPLKLAYAELKLIVNDDWDDDRFEILYDDIPKEGHSRDYMSKGRQFRYFEFKDTKTDNLYNFSYCWYEDYPYEFPLDFLGPPPEGIEFVEESVLVEKVEEAPEEAVLSPEQAADKILMERYKSIESECVVIGPRDKIDVPSSTIKDIIRFITKEKYNLYQLREKIIPICIEYRIEHKSFWTWLQVKMGNWKR